MKYVQGEIVDVCGTSDRLTLLLRGGDVLRYHTEGKQLAQQNNAEHTWRTLTILLHLWPGASRELIVAAHYHDVAECYSGDPSVMMKRRLGVVMIEMEDEFHDYVGVPRERDLSPPDLARLKTADYLEVLITACWQQTPNAKIVVKRALNILHRCTNNLSEEERSAVWALVDQILGELNG